MPGTIISRKLSTKQHLRFSHLTVENGLSDNVGGDIVQDAQGFIWISTYDGLNRFDGYEFRIFRHDPDNCRSLSNNLIRGMAIDPDGFIWLATVGGLNKFDPYAETFTRFQHQSDNPNGLGFNFAVSVFMDQDGMIWVGGLGRLDRFDPKTGTFTHFCHNPTDPMTIGQGQVHSICQDQAGTLWFGNRAGGGLSHFDPKNHQFIHYFHDPDNQHSISDDSIQVLYVDPAGKLWIGTENGGLNIYDHTSGHFRCYQHNPEDPDSLSNNYIRDIFQDHTGDLWIATAGGLNKMDYGSGKFVHYCHDPADLASISADNISRVFEDQNEGLWVTTFQGVNYCSPKYQQFRHYQHNPSDPNSLDDNNIRTIYEDSAGILWIGTEKGLNKFNRARGEITRYQHDPTDPNSPSSGLFIAAIVEDSRNILWIGTWGGELTCFDPQSEQFWRPDSQPNCPIIRDTLALCQDHNQNIWVGDYNQGLYCFVLPDEGDELFQDIIHYSHHPDDPYSLSANTVSVIYEDEKKVLWVGTETRGINRFDWYTKRFFHYQHKSHSPAGLSNNWIEAIHQDRAGHLWVGTKNGLNRLCSYPVNNHPEKTFSNDQIKSYTEKDGMPNATVIGILEDRSVPEGDGPILWLSTNQGLLKFNSQTETFQSFGSAEGLQNKSEVSGYFKGANGEMLFGGYGGLTAFYPDQIIDNQDIPPVVVTNFLLFNKPAPINGNSPLKKAIWATKEIILSDQDYSFAFEFAALSFVDPKRNQYKYKLEGFDQDWQEVESRRRYVAYTNLAAGEYTFRLIGSNNHGAWNVEGVSIKIKVAQPLWEKLRLEKEVTEAVNTQLKREIEERKQVEAKLQELAITDPLTRLYNRRHFFELAKREFDRTQRYQHNLAALMLDLDHFKYINDRYGHFVGDSVLQTVARHLKEYIRETDVLGRYGGEEFVILLPQAKLADAQKLAERLCHMISTRKIVHEEYSISVTISVGIAIFFENDTNIDMLINRADQALYTAKNTGRNQVAVWQAQ